MTKKGIFNPLVSLEYNQEQGIFHFNWFATTDWHDGPDDYGWRSVGKIQFRQACLFSKDIEHQNQLRANAGANLKPFSWAYVNGRFKEFKNVLSLASWSSEME